MHLMQPLFITGIEKSSGNVFTHITRSTDETVTASP